MLPVSTAGEYPWYLQRPERARVAQPEVVAPEKRVVEPDAAVRQAEPVAHELDRRELLQAYVSTRLQRE